MSELNIEVIGVDPPCARCTSLKKAVEAAAKKLKESGTEVKITKLNIISKDVVSKYGILVSPAFAVNGKVKLMGSVPSVNEVLNILKEATK
ncbi:MAG: thioredoxin family protein [Candidatus Methylarchaceae archaeon HK02M2]|nr:thioredoxin family protein [Candidatus Methylarchaceae archaeon HK02M2]